MLFLCHCIVPYLVFIKKRIYKFYLIKNVKLYFCVFFSLSCDQQQTQKGVEKGK